MEMKDRAFRARKGAFVVAGGAIYQRKCEEMAEEGSERWRLQ